MKKSKLAGFAIIFGLVLISQCYIENQQPQPTQNLLNFANLYNPNATTIFPRFVGYKENDSTITIYTYLYLPQLEFRTINGHEQAKLYFNFKLTPSMLNRKPLDTLSKIFVIKLNKQQKNLIFPVRLKAPRDSSYLINIYVKDLYARKSNIAFIWVDNSSNNTDLDFLLRYADDLKPVFNKSVYPEYQYLVSHNTRVDSVFVFHFKLDTSIPNPPYFLGKRIKKIFADTMFTVATDSAISFQQQGIYLFSISRYDVNGKFVSYFNEDFPLIKRASQMIPPLRYITTINEFGRLRRAISPKLAVDSFWLAISPEPAQARQLIRAYYNRVFLANVYFSTYKEGWRTDRGMIYIMFGAPQIVHLLDNQEIWYYYDARNGVYIKFRFKKVRVRFTYDYYLVPDVFYRDYWKNAVKQWRSGLIPSL